jgi:hypothetical protein
MCEVISNQQDQLRQSIDVKSILDQLAKEHSEMDLPQDTERLLLSLQHGDFSFISDKYNGSFLSPNGVAMPQENSASDTDDAPEVDVANKLHNRTMSYVDGGLEDLD